MAADSHRGRIDGADSGAALTGIPSSAALISTTLPGDVVAVSVVCQAPNSFDVRRHGHSMGPKSWGAAMMLGRPLACSIRNNPRCCRYLVSAVMFTPISSAVL